MKAFNSEKELRKIQHGNRNKIFLFVISLLIVSVISYSFALYQVRYSKRIIYTKIAPFSSKDLDLAVYVNGKPDELPEKNSGYKYASIECDNGLPFAEWDEENWNFKLIYNVNVPNKCNVYFSNEVKEYTLTKSIETYTVPKNGLYKLEVWGAQGGNGVVDGGYGGYSTGNIYLEANTKLYIGVGGAGTGDGTHTIQPGGYNGGGTTTIINDINVRPASGGGATHIALVDGVLSSLEDKLDEILIIAGGGGGAGYNSVTYASNPSSAGSGGGATGGAGSWTNNGITYYSYGGTQNGPGGDCTSLPTGYYCPSFGMGGSGPEAGGGSGLYGGMPKYGYVYGGGSGYIGNDLLTNKVMYCYHCEENNEIDTKTITTESVSDDPISLYAKKGDGYAKITLIKEM